MTVIMKPSLDLLATAIRELRKRNPVHLMTLPLGCTRAEAELLEKREQEIHPWQRLIVIQYVSPGEVIHNSETGKWDYIWPEDRDRENKSVYPDDPAPE